MPFVPHGKKAKQQRAADARQELSTQVFEKIVGRAQFAVRHAPRQALALCALVERLLADTLPAARYALKLGALHVVPQGLADPMAFDPRADDGAPPVAVDLPPSAFHAWLETSGGHLLDPSIVLTLHAEGYRVPREGYVVGRGHTIEQLHMTFRYEPLEPLELVGLADSEAYLDRAVSFVKTGRPLELGTSALGVQWREASSQSNAIGGISGVVR